MTDDTRADETQWLLSQERSRARPGDEALPGVRCQASIEAHRIVDEILRPGSGVSEDGRIIVTSWAVHRMALRLAEIAERGLDEGV